MNSFDRCMALLGIQFKYKKRCLAMPAAVALVVLTFISSCLVPNVLCPALPEFFITVDFLGTWTDSRKAVFESAANRCVEFTIFRVQFGQD